MCVVALHVVVCAAALSLFCSGVDFPQWRGANRDGLTQQGSIAWPEKLERRWRVVVGEGHSSPILAGNKVFILASSGGQEQVLALEPTTGRILWRQAYPGSYRASMFARSHGSGPKSTPVYSAGRLYTLGYRGVFSAWNADDGKLLWRKDFGDILRDNAPRFGASSSPLVEDGILVVQGGGDQGALLALDAVTGAEKWRWSADSMAYSSPVIATFGGVRHVVTLSENGLIGVELSTGKLLWQTPLNTSFGQNIITPVVAGDRVVFSGNNKGVTAVRPQRGDGAWTIQQVWQNREVSFYMSSPVRKGELLYGLSHRNKGQFVCLDMKTGQTLWRSNPRQGENAAILLAGDQLLLLNDKAELILAKAAGDAFAETRRYKVSDSETWAHPIPVDAGVIVKDFDSVALWQ